MKAYWGMEVYLHTFLTSAVDGDEWSVSRPDHITPFQYPLDRRLGVPRACLDAVAERKNNPFSAPARNRTRIVPEPLAVLTNEERC
jgi:hypothetical protein